MHVDLPIDLLGIEGEDIQAIKIVNSLNRLPRTRINVRGNRMVGAGVTKSSKKKVNNSSDIVANFHQSSSISQVELDSVFHECNDLLKDI